MKEITKIRIGAGAVALTGAVLWSWHIMSSEGMLDARIFNAVMFSVWHSLLTYGFYRGIVKGTLNVQLLIMGILCSFVIWSVSSQIWKLIEIPLSYDWMIIVIWLVTFGQGSFYVTDTMAKRFKEIKVK